MYQALLFKVIAFNREGNGYDPQGRRFRERLRHPLAATLAIFFLALVFRWPAVNYGLPYIHYWDEPTYIKLALNMMKTGEFDHGWYNIPPLFLYQHTAVQSAGYLAHAKDGQTDLNELSIDIGQREVSRLRILRWSRRATAIQGALCCVILFMLLREFLRDRTAILAGTILAIMPGFVEHSLLITADVPMTFWVLLAVWASLQASHPISSWSCACMGILAGLAFATKYNGLFVLAVPMTRLLVNQERSLALWMALLMGFLGGFTLAFPYWLIHFPAFLNGFALEIAHYNSVYKNIGISHHYGWVFLVYLFTTGLGPVISLLVLLGLGSGWGGEKRKEYAVLFVFPALYILWLLNQSSRFSRSLVPLMPWLAFFAALGLSWLGDFLVARFGVIRERAWARAALGVAVILLAALPSLLWTYRLASSVETRVKMVDWIAANVAPNEVIGIPADLHILDSERKRLPQTIVELTTSDLADQTLTGLSQILAGSEPGDMKELSQKYDHATRTYFHEVLKKRADSVKSFVDSIQPLSRIQSSMIYPRLSSLGLFHEGKWLLGAYSVNPSLALLPLKEKSNYRLQPPEPGSFQVEKWNWLEPQINKTVQGNRLAIGSVAYPFGLGAHGGSALMFPVPAGAQRFLVDVGVAADVSSEVHPDFQALILFSDGRNFESPLLRRGSPIWRVDAPIESAQNIRIKINDPNNQFNSDHAVLGYCAFIFPNG